MWITKHPKSELGTQPCGPWSEQGTQVFVCGLKYGLKFGFPVWWRPSCGSMVWSIIPVESGGYGSCGQNCCPQCRSPVQTGDLAVGPWLRLLSQTWVPVWSEDPPLGPKSDLWIFHLLLQTYVAIRNGLSWEIQSRLRDTCDSLVSPLCTHTSILGGMLSVC